MKPIKAIAKLLLAGMLFSAAAIPALADTITIAHNGVIDYAPVFYAKENGKFKQAGLDVELKTVPASGTYGAGLISDSFQIAVMTPPALLQAIDNGLDLVAISSGGISIEPDAAYLGLAVRQDSGITKAPQLEGKKIAVNALGSIFHVMAVRWLKVNGADPSKVTFVEVPLPQQGDLLKAGTVDAVLLIDPFLERVIKGGNAVVLQPGLATAVPRGITNILWVATRKWAESHRSEVQAFRKAIFESMEAVNANPTAGRDAVAAVVKMPRPIIDASYLITFKPGAGEDNMGKWVDILKEQGLLRHPINLDRLWVK